MDAQSSEVSVLSSAATDSAVRRELLEVLARAFLDNPMNRQLHRGSASARLRANRAGLKSLVLDRGDRVTTRVLQRDGGVVGGLVEMPLPAPPPPPPARFSRRLGCLLHQGPRALLGWEHVNQKVMGMRPIEPSRFIAVLGVDPDSWGRGFGSILLNEVIAAAAAQGMPVYLESDRPESIDFYRSHGFEERGRVSAFGIDCVGLVLRP